MKKRSSFLKRGLSLALSFVMVAGAFAGMGPVQAKAEEAVYKNVLSGKAPSEIAWVDGREMEFTKAGETDMEVAGNATDGNKSDPNNFFRYGEAKEGDDRRSYLEYNFGSVCTVEDINKWRYFADGRNYDPTVIVLSKSGNFTADAEDLTVVYNSDDQNVYGFGTEGLFVDADGYGETADGLKLELTAPVEAQYVRLYASGSNSNSGNHLVELEVFATVEEAVEKAPMEHSDEWISIPTFEAPGKVQGVTHPDIVEFDEPWNGYTYWMVITPNQNGNSQFENPCVAASNDGINWVVPEGITNPLTGVAEEPQPFHNCDADMVYVEEEDALYVYYVWSKDNPAYGQAGFKPSEVRLYIVEADDSEGAAENAVKSRNGEDYVTVCTSTKRYDLLSPSIVIGEDGIWRMWSVNTGDRGWNNQSNIVELRTSLNGIDWSEPVSLKNGFAQAGYYHWHIDMQWMEEKQEYWCIYPAYPYGGGSNYTELFFATSKDGLVWTTYENPVLVPENGTWYNNFIYRSTYLYDEATDMFRLWYNAGSGQGWQVAYTENTYTDMVAALGASSTPEGVTIEMPEAPDPDAVPDPEPTPDPTPGESFKDPEDDSNDYLGNMEAICDSQYLPGTANEGPDDFILDDNPGTHWHTNWNTTEATDVSKRWVGLRMEESVLVGGIRYLPRSGMGNGAVTSYEVQVRESEDGEWTKVAEGDWDYTDGSWKLVEFEPVKAKEVRLVGVHTWADSGNDAHMSVAELRVVEGEEVIPMTLKKLNG